MNKQELKNKIEEFKNEYNYNCLEISMILCDLSSEYNPFIEREDKLYNLSEIEDKPCFKESD